MIDDIAGYRFEELCAAGILRSRTDLARKQKLSSAFRLPVKLGTRQAWFPKAEVQRWLSARIAERPAATRKPAPGRQPVAKARRTAAERSTPKAAR